MNDFSVFGVHNYFSLKKEFVKIITLCVALGSYSAAQSATIEVLAEPDNNGCRIIMDGVIEPGDAEILQEIQEQLPREDEAYNIRGSLCLSGPGGSLDEALRIASFLNMQTRVLRDEFCESACAVVFFSGNLNGYESPPFPSMEIETRGRVGVHSIALPIEDRDYSYDQVLDIIDLPIQSFANVVSAEVLPPSVLLNWAITPSSDMHYLTIREMMDGNVLSSDAGGRLAYSVPAHISAICENYANMHNIFRADFIDNYPVRPNGGPISASVNTDPVRDGWGTDVWGTIVASFSALYELTQTEGTTGCEVSGEVRSTSSGLHWIYFQTVRFGNLTRDEFGDLTHGEELGIATDNDSATWEFSINSTYIYPYRETFHTLEFLSELDQHSEINTFIETISALGMSERGDVDPPSCVLESGFAIVQNVNEFVNIRRNPTLRSPVVAEARLGEGLTLTQPSSWWFMETPRGQQCSRLCEQAPGTPSLQPQLQQCIEDAEIWQQVRNSRGQTGYVSVYFLEEGR